MAFVCFEISILLKLEISSFRRVEISSFRRVEISKQTNAKADKSNYKPSIILSTLILEAVPNVERKQKKFGLN